MSNFNINENKNNIFETEVMDEIIDEVMKIAKSRDRK